MDTWSEAVESKVKKEILTVRLEEHCELHYESENRSEFIFDNYHIRILATTSQIRLGIRDMAGRLICQGRAADIWDTIPDSIRSFLIYEMDLLT